MYVLRGKKIVTSRLLAVVKQAASSRAFAIASGVAQLPTEQDRVSVEDQSAVVSRQWSGRRGGLFLREASTTTATASATTVVPAIAADATDRSSQQWNRQGRRGQRQDRGYPQQHAGSRGDHFGGSGRVSFREGVFKKVKRVIIED